MNPILFFPVRAVFFCVFCVVFSSPLLQLSSHLSFLILSNAQKNEFETPHGGLWFDMVESKELLTFAFFPSHCRVILKKKGPDAGLAATSRLRACHSTDVGCAVAVKLPTGPAPKQIRFESARYGMLEP